MQATDIKDLIEREPFRPLTVRISNGAQYTFATRKRLGAAQDYGNIVEIIETK